jgi:hypothetical protein
VALERRWIATFLASVAVAACLWAGWRIWTTPVRYEVVNTTPDGAGANRRFESRRFAEVSRLGLLPLVVPVLISGLGTWAAYRGRRWALACSSLALAIYAFISGFSIGGAYHLAVYAMALAGVIGLLSRRSTSSTVHGAA